MFFSRAPASRCTQNGPDPPLHQVCTSREESGTNTPRRAPKLAKPFKPARGWSMYIIYSVFYVFIIVYHIILYIYYSLLHVLNILYTIYCIALYYI